MKKLLKKLKSVVVSRLKVAAHEAGKAAMHSGEKVLREHALKAAEDAAHELRNSAYIHPDIVSEGHGMVVRHIKGGSFLKKLKKFGHKVGQKLKPIGKMALKELAHTAIAGLEATPLGEALKFTPAAKMLTDYTDKQIDGLGLMGRGKSKKGSAEMKARMAKVRAAKKGGALRPA
jgi:hypothetical protein